MKTIHLIDRKPFEEAIGYHCPRAAQSFFCRLEDKGNGAGKFPRLREITRRAEKDRRVGVVTATMETVGINRCVGKSGLLRHGQGVHIGSQTYGAIAGVAPLRRPTTPVLPMLRWTSMPQEDSLSATIADVRSSSKPISGWACRSCLIATSSGK